MPIRVGHQEKNQTTFKICLKRVGNQAMPLRDFLFKLRKLKFHYETSKKFKTGLILFLNNFVAAALISKPDGSWKAGILPATSRLPHSQHKPGTHRTRAVIAVIESSIH